MRIKYVLIVLVAFAAYVLGAKAGEDRYKEITHAATKYWNDPKVKKARAKAKKARNKAAKAARKKFS
ncbi:hypothetical protein F1C58_03335 [Glaciihabitans sp. INWT7]|uniref:hypothetical protein n=1 Tax=Glaciihabitans sp. INWT7 TaxID=2596912 RepID=UPI001624221E|nr:hypothetical protein [Glaciihabitans sp. INWT7]QNE46037.1 hypothetical protein F1C58_03335 [Glaciihabitans sp. INWT7]